MDEPQPTLEESKKICAINKEAVHKICSGQVVADLAIAVKELLENSLDSGATSVEIKLIDYGKTCITVIDNGSGVLEKDFEGLGLKHHTSKLKQFSDLLAVDTFGFRGEALSSLAALADLSIITRHSTSQHAFSLQFDKNGTLVEKKECARQQGTTVHVKNIFKYLPVRGKEFEKNIKKEFTKMIQILYSYCLVSKDVKIICTNTIGNKSPSVVASTNGSSNVLDNITAIFGRKAREGLIEIKIHPPDQETLEEYNLPENVSINFNWHCFVSTSVHTLGRSSPDRQFFYVNGRPCDPAKISKLINHTYHKYNNKQYPFVFFNILLEQKCADINVTPDKRTILFTQEKIILATIKSNLKKAWNNTQETFTVNTLEDLNFKVYKRTFSDSPENSPPSKKPLLNRFSYNSNKTEHSPTTMMDNIKSKINKSKSEKNNEEETENTVTSDKKEENIKEEIIKTLTKEQSTEDNTKSLLNRLTYSSSQTEYSPITLSDNTKRNKSKSERDKEEVIVNNFSSINKEEENIKVEITVTPTKEQSIEDNKRPILKRFSYNSNKTEHSLTTEMDAIKSKINKSKLKKNKEIETDNTLTSIDKEEENIKEEIIETLTEKQRIEYNENQLLQNTEDEESVQTDIQEPILRRQLPDAEMTISLESIKENMNKLKEFKKSKNNTVNQLKYTTQLSSKAADIEQELERELTKQSFVEMDIIGQFNLGFILTHHDNDIFIVDQHASDEKFRFEKLSNETKLKTQKLIVPKPLNISTLNEVILIQNQHVFEDNGFTFSIDEDGTPGHKVKLTGMPVSFGWQFGQEDIEELIFIIREGGPTNDGTKTILRPSRVREMLASRACRSAVMFGKTLNDADMRRLLTQMSQMKNPWNCPHGRPTVRHLLSLSLLKR